MSWIIGASSILGMGALVSDTSVRFADGRQADFVQKAYFVGNYIAAGFAGSVQIGFQLINSLADALAVPEEVGAQPWEWRMVAPEWVLTARRIFAAAPEQERRLGSQLLMVAASREPQPGSPFPRVDVARMAAPLFTPRFSSGLSVRHIGGGARVAQYKKTLRPLFRLGSGIRQAHAIGIHQWARQLAFGVTVAVRNAASQAESEHLHVIGVRLGNLVIYTNDMTTYAGEGPPIALKMPPVARCWEEFVAMAGKADAPAAGAAC